MSDFVKYAELYKKSSMYLEEKCPELFNRVTIVTNRYDCKACQKRYRKDIFTACKKHRLLEREANKNELGELK